MALHQNKHKQKKFLQHDYVFDSTKFTTKFPDFAVTSYVEGIKNTVEASVNGKVN
jgi:hypothetical protein